MRPVRTGPARYSLAVLLVVGLVATGLLLPIGRTASAGPPSLWSAVSEPAGQPFGRSSAGLAFDPTHGLGLLFGGRAPGGATLGDTWINDGDYPGLWSNFSDPDLKTPPPLSGAAIVWDAADQYFVLFGGTTATGTPFGGTWMFLNFDWTDISANQSTPPPPTGQPEMAYDPSDSEVILANPGNVSTTYAFEAGQWQDLSTTVTPDPRTGGLFVDATTIGGAILFGGRSAGSGAPLNDTWNFSAGAWHPDTGPAPPPSPVPVGAWDPRQGGIVAFLANYQETWGYVNGTWSSVAAPGGPAPNITSGATMYYDSVAGYDILFGGTDAFGHIPYGLWGWNIPAPYTDPTLVSAPVSPTTWAVVALVVVVPILLALLWRRPPRPSPVTAPAGAPVSA